MLRKNPISFFVFLLLCFLLFRVAFLALSWRDGRAISYDPAGYYLPLPAMFIYDDLEQFAFYDTISTKYFIGDALSHTFPSPNGNKTLKYSLGMAILYSPGFFAAHALSGYSSYPPDGYSKPYYFALSIWSIIFACIGLFFLGKVLLHYFDDLSVAITLFLVVFATNYLAYASINNLMSHSFLFSLYALLIYFSHRWHQSPSWGSSLGIGLTIGLLALSRPTEIISAIIPVLFVCKNLSDIQNNLKKFVQHWPKILLAVVVTGLIGSIQLIYWKIYTGSWLFYSYQDQGFDFLSPHIWDGLFSFRKGWLIYTPLMIFSIIGFYHLYKKKNGLFLPFFLFFLLNIYIVYSWSIWWYGGSLGSRAVIQSYPIMCFPLAAFIQAAIFQYGNIWKFVLALLAILFIDLNLIMTWQATASGGPWNAESMTKAYYFKILGKTFPKKSDKKYLDIRTELRRTKNKNFKTLLFENFDQAKDSLLAGRDSVQALSGSHSLRIDKNFTSISYPIPIAEYQPHPKAWVRVKTQIFFTDIEWNQWRLARLRLRFWRGDQAINEVNMRLQWLSDPWRWQEVYFEYPLSRTFRQVKNGDRLEVILDNGEGDKAIFFDDLQAELIEPKK